MNKIELYIKNSEGDLLPLDLFDDEPVKIEDSIQNVQDISKIFDTYSRDFKLPASYENNKLFKHYYNSDIQDGFDGRIRVNALITIGGLDYKEGFIRLISVGMENGTPKHYKVVFQGQMTTLKDKLGDKKIKDLDFSLLDFDYTNQKLVDGIRDGLYAQPNGGASLPQITRVEVIASPSQSGNMVLTTAGGTFIFTIQANTHPFTVAATIATYMDARAQFSAYRDGSIVYITSVSTSTQSETTYSPGSTGVVLQVTTPQYGGIVQVELDDNGYELYPDVIYAPLFDEFKVVPVPYQAGSAGAYSSLSTRKPGVGTYDFTLAKFTGNGANNTSTRVDDFDTNFLTRPITPLDYKPSVKVGRLIRMISEQYNLDFRKEFYQMEELDQLYMFFNGTKKLKQEDEVQFAFNETASSASSLNGYSVRRKKLTTLNPPFPNETLLSGATNFTATTGNLGGFKNSYALLQFENDTDADITASVSYYYINDTGNKVTLGGWGGERVAEGNSARIFTNAYLPMNNERYESELVGKELHYTISITASKDLGNDLQVNLSIINKDYTTSPITTVDTNTGWNTVITSEFLNIQDYSPDIKLLDLLTNIFKMFNLTVFADEDGTYCVKTLKDYYDSGKTIDISELVDSSSKDVKSLGFKYKGVEMKHAESKDILTSNYRGVDSLPFGAFGIDKASLTDSEIYQDENGDIGVDYKVDTKVGRVMFENLAMSFKTTTGGVFATNGIYSTADVVGGDSTDMVIANLIDSKLEQIDTPPILFYGKQVDTTATYTTTDPGPENIDEIAGRVYTSPVAYTEFGNTAGRYGKAANGREYVLPSGNVTLSNNDYGLTTVEVFKNDAGTAPIGTNNSHKWWNPSGIMASRFRRDRVTRVTPDITFQGLSFGNDTYDEFEFHNGLSSQEWISGLYQSNHKTYIESILAKDARLTSYKVKFNSGVLSSYKLNDTLIIGTHAYNINKISIDILSGEGTIDLVNKLEL